MAFPVLHQPDQHSPSLPSAAPVCLVQRPVWLSTVIAKPQPSSSMPSSAPHCPVQSQSAQLSHSKAQAQPHSAQFSPSLFSMVPAQPHSTQLSPRLPRSVPVCPAQSQYSHHTLGVLSTATAQLLSGSLGLIPSLPHLAPARHQHSPGLPILALVCPIWSQSAKHSTSMAQSTQNSPTTAPVCPA